jgi:mutator protein MutT
VIDVSAGLLFRQGRLLITRRHAGAHLGGLWEFPGGKRRPDESFEDCLRRELREELGIEVRVGECFESLTHAYPGKTVHLRFFFCALLAGEPRPIDCADVAWVTADELGQFEVPAADARLLERLGQTASLWRQSD